MFRLLSFVGHDDSDILGHFLQHYRSLGIDEFHVFVHGDWTKADLAPLRAADVTIAGVIQKAFDVVMKSLTLETYAKGLGGEWLVIVDADELLELPYASLAKTTEALELIGLDELPAVLLQRAAADGSLPALGPDLALDAVLPCYDYLLADRMSVRFPIWKSKYPLVRLGPSFRLSLGHHLPSAGRSSAHAAIRGVLHHFKWRDRLLRSISRPRGEGSNQLEQDAYRVWLEDHAFRLPTEGLKAYSRSAMLVSGLLMRPRRSELSRLHTLHRAGSAPVAGREAARILSTLQAVAPAAAQVDQTASHYLDRRGLFTLPGKIALVTSDMLGLRRSGGIGTAMSALAERLAAAGHEVHILLSPYADFPDLSPAWFRYWEARGVRIRVLSRRNAGGRVTSAQEMSLILAGVLAEEHFDIIHFPDAGGLAAATQLLRASGYAFEGSKIVVTVHGPTRWHRGGNCLPWAGYEAENAHLEALSLDLADVLVFPSAYMMRWTKRQFPASLAPHVLAPNILSGEGRRFGRFSPARRSVDKVVFFGRLEFRKGIDRFIAAIDIVLANGRADFEVVFLGSPGQNMSEAELSRLTAPWTCKIRLLTNYTSHEAIDFLRTENCLAVIPSRVDNSPYTVYECLANGIPLLSSDVGGIPELVRGEDSEQVLVQGDADDYAAKILDALQNGASPASLSFDPDQADLDLLALHGNLVASARALRGHEKTDEPRTASVIFYGSQEIEPLPRALERFAEDGAEILSDGDALRGQAPRPDRAGASALNCLARLAVGEHLLFCHRSVTPHAESLAAMLLAVTAMRADAIVCGYQTSGQGGNLETVPVFAGPPEISTARNIYGARFFLVRKTSFLEAGGFSTEPEIADILEWELLNRLQGSSGRVLAIPSALLLQAEATPPMVPSEYQLGRLAAPWAAAAPEPLQGFVRMAIHRERQKEQRPALSAAVAKPDVDTREIRGLELAELLARRKQPQPGPPDPTRLSEERPAVRVQAELVASPARVAHVPALGVSATEEQGGLLLDGIDTTWSDANERGRLNIAPDGCLVSSAWTYVVDSTEEADGCDFLLAADVADVRSRAIIRDTFCVTEARRGAFGLSPASGSFLRFEEILAALPEAAPPILDALRHAAELTQEFYGVGQPLYPCLVNVTQVQAGGFVMPRRPITVPRAVRGEPPRRDFAGSVWLDDGAEGGEIYFTALDIAVKPEGGRLIACTASPYHERAQLRVYSGRLHTLSFTMRLSADDMSPALRRLY